MEFTDALARLGFRESDERRVGGARGRQFVATPNRFLTYTVRASDDGTAWFSFEFAIGDYLATKGIQIGSDEQLNQFAYPREDLHGPQDGTWLTSAVERAETLLAEVRLDRPERTDGAAPA